MMGIAARLVGRDDGTMVVRDEFGDDWDIFAQDWALYAVHREENTNWSAAVFDARDGSLNAASEGQTFGVNCQDEFVVERCGDGLRWAENEEEEPTVETWRVRIGSGPVRRFRGYSAEHAAARAAWHYIRTHDFFANQDPRPDVRVLIETPDGSRWRVFHPDTSLADHAHTYRDTTEYPPLPARS